MRTRLSTLLLFIAASATPAAQAPAGDQQPTFRTGANYVRVDMYATLDGQPVTDLRPEEIEILEDGEPQSLDAFEHVQVQPAGAGDPRGEPGSLRDSRQAAADPRARVFVVFLDTYHTSFEGSANMRLPLVRFLDRLLGPDDLVALMTPEMAATDISFGRKAAAISNIMQSDWAWGRRGRLADEDPKEALYAACGSRLGLAAGVIEDMKARRREKLTLDAIDDLIVHLGSLREERKAVLAVTEGWVLYEPDTKLADAVGQSGPARPPAFRPPVAPATERAQVTDPMQIECEADRLALALLDHDVRLRRLTEEANRGNVTFYPVFARGLAVADSDIAAEQRAGDGVRRRSDSAPGAIDASAGLRRRQESLRILADNTDGSAVINTNGIDAALKRITDDLSSYYLVAYYSTNTQLDGRFRSITVRVARPRVRVRARRGYRGRTAEEVLNGAGRGETPESASTRTALNTVANVDARSAFRIRSSSWSQRGDDGQPKGSFWIVGELDYRTRRELAWTTGARAEIVVVAADGQRVTSTNVAMKTDDGTFAIRVPESGDLPAGDYAVRVRVSPDGDETLALNDLTRVVIGDAGVPFGEAVLWRRGRSTGPQYLRTADPRFQRSDRLRLELPSSTPLTGVTARMLDRAGKPLTIPVQVGERAEQTGELRWLVVDVTLAPLAPGDYAVEVRQGEARQVTGFRVVP